MSLKQLAAELRLSKSTVSRALNGYTDVNEATRQRVFEAAERLGYRPNPTALKLAKGRSDAVGIILPVHGTDFVSPAFSRILAGATEEFAKHNCLLLVTTMSDPKQELALYEQCIKGGSVDGLLVMRPRQDDPRLQLLRETGFPFVLHGRCPQMQCDWIDVDNVDTFYQLTRRQLENGHRQVAIIDASADLVLSADRRIGYLRALAEAGIEPDPAFICHGSLSVETGHTLACQLLDLPKPPSAIICADDHIAIGAMAACKERQRQVGRDTAITGYGDYEQGRFSRPQLSTVRYDNRAVGQRMAQRLLTRIQGRAGKPFAEVVPTEILARGSDHCQVQSAEAAEAIVD